MIFSSQRKCDVEIIVSALGLARVNSGSVKFLEIGTFGGGTAAGVKDWCDSQGVSLDYWGIDNRAQIHSESPYHGANFVVGDSAEVFHLIPFGFDVVLVDGCHCFNHVILDTVHYGARVRPGGIMLFHDTSPEIQQTMKDPHGPDIPEFSNSVNAAHAAIGFPWDGWELWQEDFEPGAPWGGITAYQKAP